MTIRTHQPGQPIIFKKHFHVVSPPILIVFKAVGRDANCISRENKQKYRPNNKQFIFKRCWLHLAKSVGYQVYVGKTLAVHIKILRNTVWLRRLHDPKTTRKTIKIVITIIYASICSSLCRALTTPLFGTLVALFRTRESFLNAIM